MGRDFESGPFCMPFQKKLELLFEWTCICFGNEVRMVIRKSETLKTKKQSLTQEKPQGRLGHQAKRKPEPGRRKAKPPCTKTTAVLKGQPP